MKLALKPTDVLNDAAANSRHGVLETVTFGADHPEDLTPPRQQCIQGLGAVVGQCAGSRPHSFREEGQRVGVDSIRLGELARGAGEVAHLPGLATTSGSRAVATAATTARSYPPVASRTTSAGAFWCNRVRRL